MTDDHPCSVRERTHINVELAKCDAQFEKGAVRDACYESALEISKNRIEACRKG